MSRTRKRFDAMQHPVAVRLDWETPPEFFAALDAEFHFTLDVCATAANAKCARFITPEMDGLAVDWSGEVCWMNPAIWMAKADAESRNAIVVALVPARVDTRWWHTYANHREFRFPQGRLRFVGAPFNAPFPCAVVVFRPWGGIRGRQSNDSALPYSRKNGAIGAPSASPEGTTASVNQPHEDA